MAVDILSLHFPTLQSNSRDLSSQFLIEHRTAGIKLCLRPCGTSSPDSVSKGRDRAFTPFGSITARGLRFLVASPFLRGPSSDIRCTLTHGTVGQGEAAVRRECGNREDHGSVPGCQGGACSLLILTMGGGADISAVSTRVLSHMTDYKPRQRCYCLTSLSA